MINCIILYKCTTVTIMLHSHLLSTITQLAVF